MKRTYVVIGLGKFGMTVARKLAELGNEVLAIDDNPENIQRIEPYVTCAVLADAQDEQVLKSLGVEHYDCAVVAIGSNLAASVIITLALKEMGVSSVVCKATDEVQKKALVKVGADRVVIPERETGVKLAQSLASSSVLDFIELSEDFGISEMLLPQAWEGKSLAELQLRAKHGVNVIALKKSGAISLVFDAGKPLETGTVLVLLGGNEQLEKLQKV